MSIELSVVRRKLVIILLAGFVFRIILAFITWHPDLNNHVDWGIRFWQYGPIDFYKQNVWSFSWPNQPPGTIIIFALIRKLYEFLFSSFWWVNVNLPIFPSNIMLFFEERLYQALLKLPAILADLGIGYVIFKFFRDIKKEKVGLWAAAAFLFNPVIFYNSAIWGQTDSTINLLGLLAFIFLLKRKLTLAVLAIIISLFIKLSLLIFLPIFIVVAIRQRYSLISWVKAIFLSLIVIGLLTLPFSHSEPFSWLFNLYKDKVILWTLHIITANAFNLWAALTGIHEKPDTLFFGPFTYNVWGTVLFIGALVPLLVRVYKKQDHKTVFQTLALTGFSYFILATGVHERYLYPFFPFLTILVALDKKLLKFLVVISLIHFFNLYNFWWYPRIEPIVNLFSFGDRILPRVLGGISTAMFIWLYLYILKTPRNEKA